MDDPSSNPNVAPSGMMQPIFMVPGVSFRPGRPEDLPSLIRLSKAVNYMDGGDYMPGMWLHMLSHPNWLTYVAVKDGEVVATSCTRLVRGGTRAAGVGGKTHPDIRATGLWSATKANSMAFMFSTYPQIVHVYGSTPFVEHTLDMKGSSVMWNFKDADRRHQWWLRASRQEVTKALHHLHQIITDSAHHASSCELGTIAEPELKSIMADDVLRSQLFPRGCLQLGAETYEPHEDMTDALYADFRRVVLGDGRRGNKEETDIRKEASGKINCSSGDNLQGPVSLSISSCFPCPAGSAVYMDYHGSTDIDVILQHLASAWDRAPQLHDKHGGQIFLWMSFPIETDIGKLRDILWNELGLPNDKSNKIQQVMLCIYDSLLLLSANSKL